MQILRRTAYLLLMSLMAVPVSPASAFDEINTGFFDSLALDGYDAVSYFRQSTAVKGNKSYAFEWKGATWLFSSSANRQRFGADPEFFAPQYGGYCSNQMSLGYLSDIDAEVWRIIDQRLYLFGHDEGRVRWASETHQRITDADLHWRTYLER